MATLFASLSTALLLLLFLLPACVPGSAMPFDPPSTPSDYVAGISLPPASWDAHVHVFDPTRFPYAANRSYTPEPAPLSALLDASFAQNSMIVQASIEANPEGLAAHLAQARRDYPDRQFRGTLAADPNPESKWHLTRLSEEYFKSLHELGVRCIRISGANGGGGSSGSGIDGPLSQFRIAAASYGVRELGWSISGQLSLKTWAALAPYMDSIISRSASAASEEPSPKPHCSSGGGHGRKTVLMADHNGSATPPDVGTPEFAQFLELLASGKLNVKIGALHRRATGGDLSTMQQVIKEYTRVAPRGIVWGSDWPHVNTTRKGLKPGPPLEGVDTAQDLRLMREWLTEEQWRAVMVENPVRLFK